MKSIGYKNINKINLHFFSVIDLKVIKTGVDFVFDKFLGDLPDNSVNSNNLGPLPRKDDFVDENGEPIEPEYLKRHKHRHLRNGVTALIGAVLLKQQCWENTACRIGHYLEPVAAKDVLFM